MRLAQQLLKSATDLEIYVKFILLYFFSLRIFFFKFVVAGYFKQYFQSSFHECYLVNNATTITLKSSELMFL